MSQQSPQEKLQIREKDCKAELVERIAELFSENGVKEPLPGVFAARSNQPLGPIHGTYPTALCIIAQGAKEVTIGGTVHNYDVDRYLLSAMELPVVSRIVHATAAKPYLSLRVNLDPAIVSSVIAEANMPADPALGNAKAVAVSPMQIEILEACVRLVRLTRDSEEAQFMVPLIKREIVYRLLKGAQGNRLRYVPALGGPANAIVRAIELLRRNFDQPLSIEALAKSVGMSPSGFHHQFRNITDLSPLQYQKQLRLQQARRLMLDDDLDASTAGYKVGYSDASHFSRDYKKLFGLPPARDIERLKHVTHAAPIGSTKKSD